MRLPGMTSSRPAVPIPPAPVKFHPRKSTDWVEKRPLMEK
jgi:hypothetical protein